MIIPRYVGKNMNSDSFEDWFKEDCTVANSPDLISNKGNVNIQIIRKISSLSKFLLLRMYYSTVKRQHQNSFFDKQFSE